MFGRFILRKPAYLNKAIEKLSKQVNDSSATKDLYELFCEMEKRNYNTRRIKVIGGTVGLTVAYLFGRQIKSFLSSQTSEVTIESMDNLEFQKKIQDLSTEVANQVLDRLMSDKELQEKLKNYTHEIVRDLYHDAEFIRETTDTIEQIIASEPIEHRATLLAKTVSAEILSDIELQKTAGNAIKSALYYGLVPGYYATCANFLSIRK